jgi:hypothetical protein
MPIGKGERLSGMSRDHGGCAVNRTGGWWRWEWERENKKRKPMGDPLGRSGPTAPHIECCAKSAATVSVTAESMTLTTIRSLLAIARVGAV